MEKKVILAAWEEAKLHSARFTMSDVTKRLHISKSSLYKLVTSKDVLIHGMIDYLMEEINTKEKSIQESGKPVKDRLRDFTQECFRIIQPMYETGFNDDLAFTYPAEFARWTKFYEEKLNHITSMLEEGIEAGIFKPVSLPVIRHCITASVFTIISADFLYKNNLTYEQANRDFHELFFHGLLAEKE